MSFFLSYMIFNFPTSIRYKTSPHTYTPKTISPKFMDFFPHLLFLCCVKYNELLNHLEKRCCDMIINDFTLSFHRKKKKIATLQYYHIPFASCLDGKRKIA